MWKCSLLTCWSVGVIFHLTLLCPCSNADCPSVLRRSALLRPCTLRHFTLPVIISLDHTFLCVCTHWESLGSTRQRQTVEDKQMKLELGAHHFTLNEDGDTERMAKPRFPFALMCNPAIETSFRDSQQRMNKLYEILLIVSAVIFFTLICKLV